MKAWPYPLWIAHRGAGRLAPENTLAAFRVGAAYGYRAFECDVKLSIDGVPFLLHDSSLQRTTNASGIAGDRSWHELSRIDAGAWFGRTYAGEPIPSFDAVAGYVLRNRFALNVELKPSPGREFDTGGVVAEHAQRLWHERGHGVAPPLLSSFKPEALKGALEAVPELPRALLLDSLREGWLEEAQSLGCVAVVAAYGVLDAAVIASLHAAGLRALTYTVNDAAEAQRLFAARIDGMVTDAVDKFTPDPRAIGD
jgi:glycerophosphoryl diester phosphodiesterase